MIICLGPDPPDDHLQMAGPTGWSFARVQSLQMIICKRQQQQQQWQGWPGATGQKEEKKGKEKEGKKFLWTDGHTGQSKVAQEFLADLKKCSGVYGIDWT